MEYQVIEGEGFGKKNIKTKIKQGLKVKIRPKTFQIGNNKPISLKYLFSTTKTLMRLCEYLSEKGVLINMFGEKIKWKE